jgi:hypothetical protein
MMERGSALAGNLRFYVSADPDRVPGRPGRAVPGRGLLRGLCAVLEFVRLYSAPRILSVECLPAGKAPLAGTGPIQGRGVSLP